MQDGTFELHGQECEIALVIRLKLPLSELVQFKLYSNTQILKS